MEKVYITGRGLATPLGVGRVANLAALKAGSSGIISLPEMIEHRLDSQVFGKVPEHPLHPLLDRRRLRFCPPVAALSCTAVAEALAEASLPEQDLQEYKIAVVGGVAGSFFREIHDCSAAYLETGKLRSVSPYVVPRVMPSSAVSNLSLLFGFTGETYDVSAACASSALAIMLGARLIRSGEYDIVIAGGAEAQDWIEALGFCAIRALSTRYNDNPAASSRPFDRDRDGFVLAEGAGYVVLESEKSVRRRNVRPITEISGYASNSNAKDMVVPDAASCVDVMQRSIAHANLTPGDISYVNTHGTATGVGDPVEMQALKEVFGSNIAINSTKSQTGHMIGATGAVEIIFTSMMLEHKFISPSINLENPEPDFAWADLVRELREGVAMKHAISNSFAFGGSNACVVLSNCDN